MGDWYFTITETSISSTQIWSPGATNGFELRKSHAEKETIRAANGPVLTNTEFALNIPH
jgi:hypothetical protein